MEKKQLHWRYLPEWAAWWLMLGDGGLTAERMFGPFNEAEAQKAAKQHNVPLPKEPA